MNPIAILAGASSDIDAATRMARAIVMKYGMSDKVGPVMYKDDDLSKLSPETRLEIESEIKNLLEVIFIFRRRGKRKRKRKRRMRRKRRKRRRKVIIFPTSINPSQEAKKRAQDVLRTHTDELEKLAKALLEHETLTKEEIELVLKGKPLDKLKAREVSLPLIAPQK